MARSHAARRPGSLGVEKCLADLFFLQPLVQLETQHVGMMTAEPFEVVAHTNTKKTHYRHMADSRKLSHERRCSPLNVLSPATCVTAGAGCYCSAVDAAGCGGTGKHFEVLN